MPRSRERALCEPAFAAMTTTARAEQCGHRVQPAAEDGGDLVDEDVAQHAAADPSDRTEHHRLDRRDTVVQRRRGAGDAEQREAGGVQHVDPAL